MKFRAISTLAQAAAAALVLSFATSAQAGMIIDLNAVSPDLNDASNAITISSLSTSDFVDIMQIGEADGGSHNAWNAWGVVAGCDGAGENCSKGWINNWSYFLDGDISTQTLVSDGVRYASDFLALANSSVVAPITGITSISFFIADNPYPDNLGGISLNVDIRQAPPISSVPEPSIIALFGLGLLGLGFAGRRKA